MKAIKYILEKIEKLIIRIGGPIGGIVVGIFAGIYAYALLDLSILLSIMLVPIGFVLGLIWPSKFILFAEPLLLIVFDQESGAGDEAWGSCLFNILRLIYLLASFAIIPFAIFEPSWLVGTAIMQGLYVIYMLAVDPVSNERNERD